MSDDGVRYGTSSFIANAGVIVRRSLMKSCASLDNVTVRCEYNTEHVTKAQGSA